MTRFVHVESLGSHWIIDQDRKVYVRTPKGEGPRAPGPNGEDWGGPTAGYGLQDLIEHPYVDWALIEWGYGIGLRIRLTYDGYSVTAPEARILSGEREEDEWEPTRT